MPSEANNTTASLRVRAEWLRRVEAEYRSAALTQHLTLWLIQVGAPPELVSDGMAIVADELKHARLSFEVFTAAGGQGGPQLVQETLQLRRSSAPLEEDLFVNNLRSFVLGETVAVRLFKRLRQECDVPVARVALDAILHDEVGHREFGWTVLEWMLSTPNAQRYHAIANDVLPSAFADLKDTYGGKSQDEDIHEQSMSREDRSWGLMPLGEYRQAVQQCLETDYRPRFTSLGITALS